MRDEKKKFYTAPFVNSGRPYHMQGSIKWITWIIKSLKCDTTSGFSLTDYIFMIHKRLGTIALKSEKMLTPYNVVKTFPLFPWSTLDAHYSKFPC